MRLRTIKKRLRVSLIPMMDNRDDIWKAIFEEMKGCSDKSTLLSGSNNGKWIRCVHKYLPSSPIF